jgi:hypothetical protein
MNLDSVRELKLKLSQTILANVTTTVRSRSAFGVSSRTLATVDAIPRTLALGVAPRGREFRLAIRVQHRAMENSPEIDLMRKRAKGEVDVRYVGRVLKSAKPWHQNAYSDAFRTVIPI